MRYEIEILENMEYQTNLTLEQVLEILTIQGENTTDSAEILVQLDTWQSVLFGTCLVTRCEEENDTIGEHTMGIEIDKEKIIDQVTQAFWQAMEENEREFQAYLATNPLPFEKFRAVREYYSSKRVNEQKYMQTLQMLEEDNNGLLDKLQSVFGTHPTEEEDTKQSDPKEIGNTDNEIESETDDEDYWI